MKILFAGLGSIGQRHVRNLRLLRGSNLELLAYRVRGSAPLLTDELEVDGSASVEVKYGIRSYADLDEALAQAPQAVFVCNPTRDHVSVALAAARAGCHLFIEKPLSDRAEGIDELIACTEAQGLVSLVGYQLRFHPVLSLVRALLDSGTIGRVIAARIEVGEFLPSAHPYEDYRESYAGRADLGGGVVMSHSHEIDYACWLFGMPGRIFATGGHLSGLEIDVEDAVSSLMECVIDGSPVAVQLSQDFIQRPPVQRCQIVGESGMIRADLRAPLLQIFDGNGGLVECRSFDGYNRNDVFVKELTHFFACLAGREAPAVTLRDAARSLRVALAIKESMASRQLVELS
jgi:predicted dehydrogenase